MYTYMMCVVVVAPNALICRYDFILALALTMVIGHYKTDGVLLVEAQKHVGPMQGFGFRAKYSTDTTLPMPRPCSF